MIEKEHKSSPTMNEVAQEAKVSVATVSRVVNKSGGVSKKLERRVLRAMKKLSYHPSSLARSLKVQQTNLVGLIVPMLEHAFYSRLATSIETQLFENDYRAIICNSGEDEKRELAYVEMLLRQRVDGIIINSSALQPDYLQSLNQSNVPIVLIDRDLPDVNCMKVFSDNYQGGGIAARHLLELGHRRIGIVVPMPDTEPVSHRFNGAKDALAQYGLVNDPELIVSVDTQLFDMGYQAGKQLLELPSPPTAILALTDVTAVGVMHAAAEMGLQIPEDLSVMGYDNVPIASYTIPPLTTVEQPIVEMGKTSVHLLLKRLNDEIDDVETAILGTHLVMRQSTTPLITITKD